MNKFKKTISIILSLLMIFVLCSCGESAAPQPAPEATTEVVEPDVVEDVQDIQDIPNAPEPIIMDIGSGRRIEEAEVPDEINKETLKTYADLAKAADYGIEDFDLSDDVLYCTFDIKGDTYRAKLRMTPDVAEKMEAIDYASADYRQQINDALSDLEVFELFNASQSYQLPEWDELVGYIGQKGQVLLNDGFVVSGADGVSCLMSKDAFEYAVEFSGIIEDFYMETARLSEQELYEFIKTADVRFIEAVGYSNDA